MSDELRPQDVAAERQILNAVMNDAYVYEEISYLTPDDFYDTAHSWIWEAIQGIAEDTPIGEQTFNFQVVQRKLEANGRKIKGGWLLFLTKIVTEEWVPFADLVAKENARAIAEMATRRRLLDSCSAIARLSHSKETPIEDVLSKVEDIVIGVRDRHAVTVEDVLPISSVAADVMLETQVYQNNPRDIVGMKTGLRPLDNMLLGVEPGLAYWIAGRPGMGKSSLLAQMAWGLAENGHPVLFFSLEMKAAALVRRMICQKARVSYTASRLGRLSDIDFRKFKSAAIQMQDQEKYPLYIEDRAGRTVSTMRSIARRYADQHGIKAVFIDTINRIGDVSHARDQYHGMTAVSHAIADWAHESEYAVLVAAQLSRGNQLTGDKRPTLATLRDAGSQEEDADVVIGIHRPGYYNPENDLIIHEAELLPLKIREGATDTMVKLYWEPSWPGFGVLETRDINSNLDALRPAAGQD